MGCKEYNQSDFGVDHLVIRTKCDGGCDRSTKHGREELPHVRGQGWQPGGDIPRPKPEARGDRQEEKGTAEDEMAGWHHLLDGHEFE